jgi:hypothetical protein
MESNLADRPNRWDLVPKRAGSANNRPNRIRRQESTDSRVIVTVDVLVESGFGVEYWPGDTQTSTPTRPNDHLCFAHGPIEGNAWRVWVTKLAGES